MKSLTVPFSTDTRDLLDVSDMTEYTLAILAETYAKNTTIWKH